ncbi:helix-turn-helix transcriptional regulator [Actinoallomurus iriomotensis]|uniref:helix-turn-helix transcriptional regulator n=1 Tax=Actinoallomurus iriomotensis TaxID=478107 RepID=UPI002552A207|nr:HTH domain-containing protein [Actinoallomurus iriomotensis]
MTTLTIRDDIGRLRELGDPIDARPGVAGGYRIGTGATMPPLLLDDEEAVAVVIGLRTAASGSIAGVEETSVRTLAKPAAAAALAAAPPGAAPSSPTRCRCPRAARRWTPTYSPDRGRVPGP